MGKKDNAKTTDAGIRQLREDGSDLNDTAVRKWVAYSKNLPLAVTHPEIAAQWHGIKNGTWTPYDFTKGSHEVVWWKCPAGPDHEWRGIIKNRVHSKSSRMGCPFCAGHQPLVTNTLASLHPELAKQWDFEKNGDLTPETVVAGSSEHRWWKCDRGPDHSWKAEVASRSKGNGCPFCAGVYPSVTNSLATVAPEVARQWDYRKNGKLTPRDIVAYSKRKVWWKCDAAADHEWQASCNNRVGHNTGCPACSGYQLSLTNSLWVRARDAADMWHPTKNEISDTRKIHSGSSELAYWLCKNGHEWKERIDFRVKGKGCPYCNRKRACVDNSFAHEFPGLAAEWHSTRNNALLPDQVLSGSKKNIWWQCKLDPNHEWQAPVCARTRDVRRAGCPECS